MSVEIVRIEQPRLNAAAAKPLMDKVSQAWSKGARVVVLDFSDVVSMDSLGLSALVAAHRARPEGGKIVLSSLNDYVRDVLEITAMFRVFDVYDTAEAAAKAA